jgi:hypothetical protein
MITQTFRVTRVLAGHSPVARIDGVDDDDGLELRLEVPVDAVRGASPGQVLVVNWTLQASATPAKRVESRAAAVRRPAVIDAEFTTAATPAPRTDTWEAASTTRPAGAAPRSIRSSCPSWPAALRQRSVPGVHEARDQRRTKHPPRLRRGERTGHK